MLILANVLALALIAADEPKTPTAPTVVTQGEFKPGAAEVWPMTLPEAIRIGLDNSEVIRVIALGAQSIPVGGFEPTPLNAAVKAEPASSPGIVIAQVKREASTWNFKAAVMAHVRSIEQQYWSLAEQQVALWARETAVKLGEEILRRERAGLQVGQASTADVAEAEQQLENFKLNLVSATSDLITTERQLRNILGLPASDNRRIVANTAGTEAKVDPAWEACIREMEASQPDIAQQRRLVRVAELKSLIEGENPTLPLEQREASKRELAKQQAFLQEIRHQTTHSLARFFLEIDANYKQFQTAQKLRGAAQKRLEAQRAFYEEGRITIDRLLDAVSQYANAIAQEAQYKSSYNTSIVALEEAKGTLLACKGITVADGPTPRKTDPSAKLDKVAPASFEAPAATTPATSQPAPTTYKLRAKFGGVKFLEIELEMNESSTPKATEPGR